MKNSSKIFYLFIGLTLAVVVLVFTFLELNINNDKDKNDANIKEDDKKIDELLTTEINSGQNKKITENTIIEYETYYTECGDTIREFEEDKDRYIGMDKEELENSFDEDSTKEVIRFDTSRVVIKTVENHLCPNHYVIGEHEGYVAIYKIDKQGNRELFKTLDQSIELLSEYDIERLKKGIVVDSLDDIGEVIENFIS